MESNDPHSHVRPGAGLAGLQRLQLCRSGRAPQRQRANERSEGDIAGSAGLAANFGTVVPIHGTHFRSYAKLFCKNGIEKKCAIVTDGDLKPSDANPDASDEFDDEIPAKPNVILEGLKKLENEYLKVFSCDTTFELELAEHPNLAMFSSAADFLGAPKTAKSLLALSGKPKLTEKERVAGANRVLATAKRFGKARFAQVVSAHIAKAGSVPEYIKAAVEWLRS